MIPRVIYTFWDGPTDPVVEHCLRELETVNRGDCSVVRLDRTHVPPTPTRVTNPKTCHVADWVRIWYLARYGGVWMDASCLCAQPVREWVDFESDRIQGFGAPWDGDVMENWAMAVPTGSPFVAAWAEEFAYALSVGFVRYRRLRWHRLPETVRSRMPYLTMHGAYCVVRDRLGAPVHLRPSTGNHGPFAHLSDHHWNPLLAVLAMRWYCGRVPFLKLRRQERIVLRVLRWARWVLAVVVAWALWALVRGAIAAVWPRPRRIGPARA